MEPVIDVHLGPEDLKAALRDDVARGLTSAPKELPPKWFYDDVGSALFDAITRLAEYYPTEAEREILIREAGAIVSVARAHTIVELGSGTSDKTRALLDAARTDGRLRRFIPFDVSEPFLRTAARRLARRYPGLEVHGVVGDFDHHLGLIPGGGSRLVIMLGGTIGNYEPDDRKELLASIVSTMRPGDHFLLGTDLVKDPARLELAYDDPAGVTAAFNKNVLGVVNRELDADFRLDRFTHVARYDRSREWIEMFLRSTTRQRACVRSLGLKVDFEPGELMRTEVSAKFRPEGVEAEVAAAGLELRHWWTDERGDYGVSLSRVS
ncbi:MAG: L-histidine N(alpha)-methyltransferase [Acidimicrobiales bacterium]